MTSQVLEDIMKRIKVLENYMGLNQGTKPVSERKLQKQKKAYEIRKKIIFKTKAK